MKWLRIVLSCVIFMTLVFLISCAGPTEPEDTTSPSLEWSQTFGGSGDDEAYSVQQTNDGGYILAGMTGCYGAGGRDAWLIKTDAQGTEQWSQTFGGSGFEEAHSVQQTMDGGYILAGWTLSGSWDALLIKTDAQGTEQWIQTFGGRWGDNIHSVQQTADGGYILAGETNSECYTGNIFEQGIDALLIKTDAQGTEQWSQAFGGSDIDLANSVQQTADGGYILAGYYTGSWALGYRPDAWLLKTDAQGAEQWNQIFGGSNKDRGNSVQQTADGGYILAGETTSYGAGNMDAWLTKTDAQGDEQWSWAFGGSNWDDADCVQQTTDGGYILAGSTRSLGAGIHDALLIKTDAQGSKQWEWVFGGSNMDKIVSVQQTTDGGYILAGWTASFGAGSNDAWLIKVRHEN